MSREKDLAKNTVILTIGKFLPRVTALVTLPILTAYLSKAEYGAYDLISTLVMLIIPVATLQMQSAAFRFLIEKRKSYADSSSIITNIFAVTIPISIICSIIVQFFFIEYGILLRILIVSYLFLDSIQNTIGQITRGLGDNKHYAIATCTLTIVNMLCIVLLVYWYRGGLTGVLLSLCIAQLISILFLSISSKLWSYFNLQTISKSFILEMMKYSWPMVPNNLSNWVLKLSDRLVITGFLGIEANAVYGVANRIPGLLSIAQSGLIMAWHENASLAVNDNDSTNYFSRMLDSMYSLMFAFTALLIAGTPIIFAVLIRGDYSEAYYQMPVLILAMFFFVMSAYLGGIYVAHKRTVSVGTTTMIAAGINLFIDLTLVQSIGIWAGSLSTLAAYCFLYYFRMFNCQKFQKIKVHYGKQAIQLLILIIMLSLCFVKNIYLDGLNLIVGVSIFAYITKDKLLLYLKKHQ